MDRRQPEAREAGMASPGPAPAAWAPRPAGHAGMLRAPRASAPRQGARRRGVMLLLVGLLLTTVAFGYVSLIVVPAWAGYLAAACGVVLLSPRLLGSALTVGSRLTVRLFLPWALFTAIVLLVDWRMGALGSSLGRVILVDAASLVIFVLAFSWARLLRPRDLIMMLALFGAIEGAISMGQFGGSQPLWKFPETIATASGTPLTALMRERQTFEDVGRARGTQLFVHVFTSMEAVLAAFLLVAAAGARAAKVPAGRGYSWVLLIAAVVSFLGVVLSFSRSGVLGCVAVVPVALIGFRRTSRTRALLFLLLTGLAVLGANAALNVTAGAKYQRLFDYSSSNSNNAARLGVVELAWSAFIEAPLTGGGSDVGVGRSAIAIHSVPMRVLGSYGIVAFAAYIAVLASLAQTFWKRLRTATQWEQVAAVAGLAGLAAGLVDAFTHTSGLLMSDVAQAALLGTFLGAAWQAPAPAARRRAGPAA